MPVFIPHGPFVLPLAREKNGRFIDEASIGSFWEEDVGENLDVARGCYVFAIRAGKGYTPVYVGKATKTFRQECFSLHKLKQLNKALTSLERGNLVLFLVSLPPSKGRPNTSAINMLEKFLIKNAVAKNPSLMNIHGTKDSQPSIKGVVGGPPGAPLNAATELRRAMGL